jgi:hypothetical protein
LLPMGVHFSSVLTKIEEVKVVGIDRGVHSTYA